MADATVSVKIADLSEVKALLRVAMAATEFMRWAAPVSMEFDQWEAWRKLEEAVSNLGQTLGQEPIPPVREGPQQQEGQGE